MRPSGPGVAVTNPCAYGAARASPSPPDGRATPKNNRSIRAEETKRGALIFIGKDYIKNSILSSRKSHRHSLTPEAEQESRCALDVGKTLPLNCAVTGRMICELCRRSLPSVSFSDLW